jgi:hypothetical protein
MTPTPRGDARTGSHRHLSALFPRPTIAPPMVRLTIGFGTRTLTKAALLAIATIPPPLPPTRSCQSRLTVWSFQGAYWPWLCWAYSFLPALPPPPPPLPGWRLARPLPSLMR